MLENDLYFPFLFTSIFDFYGGFSRPVRTHKGGFNTGSLFKDFSNALVLLKQL